MDLDPLFLKDLDEVDAFRYADPGFKRRQEEGFTQFSSGGGSVARSALDGGRRPIKPLPRKSLNSSQGSSHSHSQSQPQPQQSHTITTNREVIEIDDSSSSKSSPKPKTRRHNDDDIEVFDVDDLNDEDYRFEEEEEQYDKENMPVMTRHVRRKIVKSEGASLSGGLFGKGGGGGDVIELSDED